MLMACLLAPSPTAAQVVPGTGSGTAAPALPETLSPQTIRDLIARLNDDEVRALLIRQLDKVATSETTPATTNASGFVDDLEAGATSVRELWASRVVALPQLPGVIPFFFARMADGKTAGQLVLTVVGVVIVFGFAVLVERVFLHLTAKQRSRIPDARVERFTTRMGYLLQRFAWQIVGLILFTVGALVAFFALYQGHVPTRMALIAYLSAIVILRLMSDVSRFLLAPHAPNLRLIPLSDDAANSLHRWIIAVGCVGAFGFLTADLLGVLGIDQPVLAGFRSLIAVAFVMLLILTIWHTRKPISALIAGPSPGPLRRLTANWWHILAILYVFGIWLTAQVRAAVGGEVSTGGAILSLLLVIALPLVDITLQRLAADYFEARRAARRVPEKVLEVDADGITTVEVDAEDDDEGGVATPVPAPETSGSYEPAMLKALRIVLWIGGFLVFTHLWDIDIYDVTQQGVGETAAGALFNVVITILLGFLCWEVIAATIDRRIEAEAGPVAGEIGGEGGGHGGSRLRTLLPLARKAIFVTLVVMVVMIILSSLGVHIGPLLAGAGVVGIAIGFGAQTLVRDIVSGVFYLLDDAFRVGEYIDLGEVKGTVEKISIRSMQLRHHRGALNTVPFGEIKYLTNYSRDWAIMKLQFRVTYDTDVNQVKKIFKQINVELMENEEIAANLLEPLKSQGVLSMEDSAMIIRAKFTAKPGEQFVIRREVYTTGPKSVRGGRHQVRPSRGDRACAGGGAHGSGPDRPGRRGCRAPHDGGRRGCRRCGQGFGVTGMQRYSIAALVRNAFARHESWAPVWRDPNPRQRYRVVVLGAGGHGLATAYYLAKEHGITDVAVLDKGWLGGGNTGRNTTIIRSNYLCDASAAIYDHAVKLWEGLSQELNYNVMFSQRGVMHLAHSVHDLQEVKRRLHANRLNGVDSEFLLPEQIKQIEPLLDTSRGTRYPIMGASLQRRGGTARHDAVAWGYARGCRRSRRRHHPELRGHRGSHRPGAGPGGRDHPRSDPLRQAGGGGRRPFQRDRADGGLSPADRELSAAGPGLRAGQALRQHGDHVERGARLHQPVGQGRTGDRRRHRPVHLLQPARQLSRDRAYPAGDRRAVPGVLAHAHDAPVGRRGRRHARPQPDHR